VRAWQKLHTFRGEARFSTWLHRLAVNLILSRRAAFATEKARFLADDEALERIETRPCGREHSIDFEGAIGRLPEGARMIFVLHDIEGYRHEEIAGLLGFTSGTTKAQLHRARMLLRGHLDPELARRKLSEREDMKMSKSEDMKMSKSEDRMISDKESEDMP